MLVEPGGHVLDVPRGTNVLAAALAAGLALPHSCRAGRCASCKAKLLSGEIEYPDGRLPPGIVAAEAARGEVLLCQARPASDLVVEARRTQPRTLDFAECELTATRPLAFGAMLLVLRVVSGALGARPGQFVDVRNAEGLEARLAVIAVRAGELELEAAADGGQLREWLDGGTVARALLRVTGPFEAPR